MSLVICQQLQGNQSGPGDVDEVSVPEPPLCCHGDEWEGTPPVL